ncbi:MAG: diacylglycerol kinase family lipid kinase [Chloroflexi bacterium]|nr:diacylglycerol kinase family lipid kinase [Chloroflexota bacterium]
MPRIKIILNPMSGSGTGRQAEEVIRRTLTEEGVTFEIVETTGRYSAIAQAAEAVRAGWEIIAAVGGDGVANEVLNGIVEASQSTPAWEAGEPIGALGLVPIGTGNDFAWCMGLPTGDAAAACRVLAAGKTKVVDIGRVEDELGNVRYFCNNFGAGFDAATTVESYKLRYLRGSLVFLVAVLRTIFLYYKAPLVTVRCNEQERTLPLLMASVANGRRTGGMFMIAPQAVQDDGLLDVTLARQVSRLGMFRLLPYFVRGTHATQPTVMVDRAAHVVIASEQGLPVHVDGEVMRTDARRLEVSVLPRRLRVVC